MDEQTTPNRADSHLVTISNPMLRERHSTQLSFPRRQKPRSGRTFFSDGCLVARKRRSSDEDRGASDPGGGSPGRRLLAIIQNSFTVTRGIINLNNGGVSPSPRIVTEALVRYIWQQEDATAYTMWQILEPQSETIRTGLAELFGCDREEIAITRNASESLEILLMGMDLKPGDEILTTTRIIRAC